MNGVKLIELMAASIDWFHQSNYGVIGYEFFAPINLISLSFIDWFNLLNWKTNELLIKERDEIKWSEREDWIELVGPTTYNPQLRLINHEMIEWRRQPINQTNLHFTSLKEK